jgi:hypothetical protein
MLKHFGSSEPTLRAHEKPPLKTPSLQTVNTCPLDQAVLDPW